MRTSSAAPPIEVALGTYSAFRFGETPEEWAQLASAVDSTFGGPPLRHLLGFCLARPNIRTRSLAPRSTMRVSNAVRAGDVFEALLSNVPLSQADHAPQYASAVIGYGRRAVSYFGMPELDLPYELGTHRVLQPAWPSESQSDALRTLLQVVHAEYACIFVGQDHERALSEWKFSLMTKWPRDEPDPAWIAEMTRINRDRHLFGTKVRGAYWGNLLPAHIVHQIGGLDALRSTGADIVEEWSNGRVYVQLTTTVGEAVTPEGEVRLSRLERVLRPVAI